MKLFIISNETVYKVKLPSAGCSSPLMVSCGQQNAGHADVAIRFFFGLQPLEKSIRLSVTGCGVFSLRSLFRTFTGSWISSLSSFYPQNLEMRVLLPVKMG